jgi:hypothetical protein
MIIFQLKAPKEFDNVMLIKFSMNFNQILENFILKRVIPAR